MSGYTVTLFDYRCKIDHQLEDRLAGLAVKLRGSFTGVGSGLGARDYSFRFDGTFPGKDALEFVKKAKNIRKSLVSKITYSDYDYTILTEPTTMTTTVKIVELKKNIPMYGVHKARAKAAKKIAGRALTGVLHINRACTIVRLYTSDGQVTTSWHKEPVDVNALAWLFKQGLNIELNTTPEKVKGKK